MRAALRALGETGVTLGAVLLLFCAYLVWGTGSYTGEQQVLLRRQLVEARKNIVRSGRLGEVPVGGALAMLRIPRLGDLYRYAVVEGVDWEQLRMGPGHYPGSALPGKIGNFVISGHRTTYAAPFNRLDELHRGDYIVVDARDARYTYRVTGKHVVDPTDLDVIAPNPAHPDRRPIKALITLSTCHPEYSAAQRLIVTGELENRRDHRPWMVDRKRESPRAGRKPEPPRAGRKERKPEPPRAAHRPPDGPVVGTDAAGSRAADGHRHPPHARPGDA
ncbi:class E sortase [Streptosporangium sp. NPDC048047]|uniref:class E sortase n=1 Tax=Streptosporangium sp. NPDC048047 TaxID=3155748 RepID=UPI0034154A1F